MPSLLDLPPELIHLVYDVADVSVVCRLRLTNRALCKLGDEHLLPEVTAFMHRRSLDAVEQIASSRPAIRSYIKSFFFQSDGTDFEFENLIDEGDTYFQLWNALRHQDHERQRDVYKSLLATYNTAAGNPRESAVSTALSDCYRSNERANEDYPTHDVNEMSGSLSAAWLRSQEGAAHDATLKRAFEHYKTLLDDERNVRDELVIRTKPKTLFLSCPNLTKLSFNMKDTLRPNSAFKNPEWLRGLLVPNGAIESGSHAFPRTMQAAFDASLNLQDLSVGLVSAVLANATEDNNILMAMKNLTRLQWKFEEPDRRENDISGNTNYTFDECIDYIHGGHLAQVLSSCPVLEILHLDLMYHPLGTLRAALVSFLPSGPVFAHLRRLRLTNFQAMPQQLSSFILGHSATLQHIHLHNVHLYHWGGQGTADDELDENGTFWQTCIEAFAGKLPALESVRLTGRFTSYGSNGTWYYGRKSRSPSGEDGFERSSSVVIEYILTGTRQYSFPAPSFDDDLARLNPIMDLDGDDSPDSSDASLDDDDMVSDEDDDDDRSDSDDD